MNLQSRGSLLFVAAGLAALLTFQGFYLILVILMWFAWEDSKWPAFDSDDYDRKMMKGPLKPWQKGN